MSFTAPADDLVGRTTAFGDPILGASPVDPRRARDIGDALISGLQSSALGLAFRGKLPDQALDESAPWYHRIAAGGAGMVADLPLSVAGAFAGAPVGAAVTGPAAPAGALVGAGAGAFAVPMALREALIEAYSNNHAMDWNGVWEIGKAALTGGGKGAVIGGLTFGAGRVVAPLAAPLGRAAPAAVLGAELTTLTTTAAALEGHMPTWQDFMDNAILLGGAKAAVSMAKGLHGVYVETGRKPAQVAADAKADPAIAEALKKGEMPEAYRQLAIEERVKAALEQDKRPDLMADMLRQAEDPALPLLKDSVRYDYITDRETAQQVVRAAAEAYKDHVELERRGVVPTEKSFADATALIQEGKLPEHTIGRASNDAELVARAMLTKGAAERARRVADEIAALPPEAVTLEARLRFAAAMEQVGLFYGDLAGAGAEAGRALRMLREIKRDPNRLGDAETLVKLYEKKGTFQDIAAMARALKDPEQMRAFAEKWEQATTMDMAIEGWKAAILSGPQTHLANILGNLTRFAVEIPEATLAAALEATRLAVKGEPMSMALFKAKAFGPLYGVRFGARDSLTIAAEVWKQKGEHLEKADVYKTAIPGQAGHYIRTPFRALQVEDAFFRTFGERAKAHELAVERTGREGFQPGTREFNEAVVRYTQKPQLGLTEKQAQAVTKEIQDFGAEAVFAQRLGPRMETVQRAMAGSPVQFIMPFFRTPVNLISWAVQHTPGMNFMSARWWSDFGAGGARRDRAIARVTVGTALAVTAFQLAEDGLITGSGMFAKEEKGTKRAAGWQPYSFFIDGQYYSYQRIEPVAKVIGMAADLVELQKALKDPADKAKVGAMLVMLFGNATVSTTYMSGLSNVLNGVTDPERYGEALLEQYASSLVPKIIGQSVATVDPYQREVEGALEAIQSQLPFLREKLLPRRDVWGEPVENNKWFAVMPVQTSKASEDKVKTEAMRLQLAIQDAPRYIMERGPFNPSERRVELAPEQRDIYKQVAGKNAMTILTPIVNAPDWDRIPDFAKAAIYKHVIEGTRKQGAYAALPPADEARVKLREKIVDRIIRETQEAESK